MDCVHCDAPRRADPRSRTSRLPPAFANERRVRSLGRPDDTVHANLEKTNRHPDPHQSLSYRVSRRSAYFCSTARRRIFWLGVTSPSSRESSAGRMANLLIVSHPVSYTHLTLPTTPYV